MKISITILAVSVFLFSCKSVSVNDKLLFDDKIYDLNVLSDNKEITSIIDTIIRTNTDLDPKLSTCKLLSNLNLKNQELYHYLLITDDKRLHKVAILVFFDKTRKVFEVKDKVFAICFASTDCNPSFYDKNWGCDTEVMGNFDCKKSVVIIE